MALKTELIGQRVYVDANIIIFVVEEPTPLSAGQFALFRAVEEGLVRAVTSELSLTECLVHPLTTNDIELASTYERLLSSETGLELVPVSREILIGAAHVRARQKLKTPDAIHLASAVSTGATVFLTDDRRITTPAQLRLQSWRSL